MKICKFYLIFSAWKGNFIFAEILHAEKCIKIQSYCLLTYCFLQHAICLTFGVHNGNCHHLMSSHMLNLFSFLAYKANLPLNQQSISNGTQHLLCSFPSVYIKDCRYKLTQKLFFFNLYVYESLRFWYIHLFLLTEYIASLMVKYMNTSDIQTQIKY